MASKDCVFNIGIDCTSGSSSQCSKCGWNPKVEKERKDKLREGKENENEKKSI